MRMRKKAWAIPFLEANKDLVIQDPTSLKGKWKQKLGVSILHVEIGIGRGAYFHKMSKMYPDEGWVGIEKEKNVAAVACKKLVEDPSSNRLVIASDASGIDQWFSNNEVDVIHLNFSDPWHKNPHKKRRLTHQNFINQYMDILSENGQVIIKTDNSGLFEFSILEFLSMGFKMEDISVDFRRNIHDYDAITEYEEKFIALNQPIYRVIFKKEKEGKNE